MEAEEAREAAMSARVLDVRSSAQEQCRDTDTIIFDLSVVWRRNLLAP